jgi:acetylornithine/N-succinyldiaminopimelate aminotransferase
MTTTTKPTETDHQQIQEIDQKHYLQVYKRFPLTLVKGRGSKVWDANGKEYIDVLAGIAVNSVGHCHPRVVKAIQEQAAKLIHISNFYVSVPQAQLTKKLVELSGLDRVFLSNSGAEAVESAIKLARKYSHSKGRGGHILSLTNCFHGRTMATIATGKRQYQEGFDPIPSGFKQLPFNDIEALRSELSEEVGGIILEPIQGEGGIHVVDKDYLKEIRALCNQHDIPLILDEIQCGVGRSGSFFAFQQYGVEPDILTSAKALGGGTPIGATMCKQHIADAINYGQHGTTYGGNPLVCAASLATIEAIEEEYLVDQAWVKGDWLIDALNKKAGEMPIIKEVRGKGLMIGVELDMKDAKRVVIKMMEKGVLSNVTAGNVVRLVPPLNITRPDLEKVFETLIESIKELEKEGNNE